MPSTNPLRLLTSLKVTAGLLTFLALLLFLNIALPQAGLMGAEAFAELVAESAWRRFFLVTLKLGYLSTSPLFLVALGFFFLHLTLVLGKRLGPTWRKLRVRPRSEAGLRAWARTAEALTAPLPGDWTLARAVETLRGFGYRVERVGERGFLGLKHRTAPLGFLLFHLSFFLLFGGGILLYATRFVGRAVLTEGQEFSGSYGAVLRRPPLFGPPQLAFAVAEVEPRFDRGEPVHLGARFYFQQAGSTVEKRARINQPAKWGPTSVLVREAGLAPVLWLQDDHGFTLDQVAVPVVTRGATPTIVPLGGGRYLVSIAPLAPEDPFPERGELGTHPLALTVVLAGDREAKRAAETVFEGTLSPGQAAELGGDRLVLKELRYWVGVQVVSERGGGLLTAGFVVGIVGLVWRLGLYRREVALVWDDDGEDGPTLRLVGHSEYFPERFRDELAALLRELVSLSRAELSRGK